MGILRKGLFVATGGASGAVFKANSKKERAAKAAEKQVRLMKQQARAEAKLAKAAKPAAEAPAGAPSLALAEELSRLAEMHTAGVLTDEEFAAAKARLLA